MHVQQQPVTSIAWTIAGSDSGGGAGIQADLATFRDFGVHGCSVITALTAQNSIALARSLPTPSAHVGAQIDVLAADLPAAAIKLGMLPTSEIIAAVHSFLDNYSGTVVYDPVMRSSTGISLLAQGERGVLDAMRALLPHVTIVTPNIAEAQALTGLVIDSVEKLREAAAQLVTLGAGSALITGGHFRLDPIDQGPCVDYWTDGERACFLAGEYLDTAHTHGSGCNLSSAIAALLALGFELADSLVVAKAYVTAAIRAARGVGAGPGPLAHPGWPGALVDWPGVGRAWPATAAPGFPACQPLGLYPVVDDVAWLERLLPMGIKTIQLRIKRPDEGTGPVQAIADEAMLRSQIARAVALANRYDVQLFINDHWALAIECGAFGVHLGQEDLDAADLAAIAGAGLRLGISTHSDFEIARAHQLRPSYIAIGPIYPTTTKQMVFAPQGLDRLQRWVRLLGPHYPLTAIGGIDLQRAPGVLATGVGSCAVVRAVTQAPELASAVHQWLAIHQRFAR
jgi:hydroxymethylpyrimidine kinase/phosphomethylpyrimidine kinase/thiamine-phosphate diphosphorylase